MIKTAVQASFKMEERLKTHGLRVTHQRLQLALRVLSKHDHFTADDILAWSVKSSLRLSRATIYNTLNEFVAVGLLRSFQLSSSSGQKLIFDSNTGSHFHFLDTSTHEIFDLAPGSVSVKVKDLKDYLIEETEVFFRGRRIGQRISS